MRTALPDLNKPVFRLFPIAKDMVRAGACPMCHKDILMQGFRDSLSIKEYGISGLCQSCQDKVFG